MQLKVVAEERAVDLTHAAVFKLVLVVGGGREVTTTSRRMSLWRFCVDALVLFISPVFFLELYVACLAAIYEDATGTWVRDSELLNKVRFRQLLARVGVLDEQTFSVEQDFFFQIILNLIFK